MWAQQTLAQYEYHARYPGHNAVHTPSSAGPSLPRPYTRNNALNVNCWSEFITVSVLDESLYIQHVMEAGAFFSPLCVNWKHMNFKLSSHVFFVIPMVTCCKHCAAWAHSWHACCQASLLTFFTVNIPRDDSISFCPWLLRQQISLTLFCDTRDKAPITRE